LSAFLTSVHTVPCRKPNQQLLSIDIINNQLHHRCLSTVQTTVFIKDNVSLRTAAM